MNGQANRYLQLAALAAVGETLLDPRSAFVFAADGSCLLFANAAAADFFGELDIGALLQRRFSDLNPIKAQMARLARVLPGETARLEILQLGQGVSLTMLPAACRRLVLPDDGRAVLAIAVANVRGDSLVSRAVRLVDVIGGDDRLAAVLSAEGKVLAASGSLDAGVPTAIETLIARAHASGERLVKAPLTLDGGERRAGAARFRAEGRDYFLLVLDAVEAARVPLLPISAAEARAAPPLSDPVASEATPAPAVGQPITEIDEPALPAAASRVVRFVFEADQDARFTFVSPELAETIGDTNGAIRGLRWPEIASILGFAAAPAFAGGDGFEVTVDWAVGDGEAVAVTLSGSPVRGADHRLDGYRGFGTIRPDERKPDRRDPATGLDAIRSAPPPVAIAESEAPAPVDEAIDLDEAARRSIEQGATRSRSATPAAMRRAEPPAAIATTSEPVPSNVVHLPGGRTSSERLTGTERDAFRRIAEALGTRRDGEAEPPPVAEAERPARKEAARAPAAEVDTRLLDRLPIGIAVFRNHKTLFANRTLLDLLGYDAYDVFLEAGGSEAIFPGVEGLAGGIAEAGGRLAASRRDGSSIPVKAWLHAVTWAGATALMLSLSTSRDRDGASEDEQTLELARTQARTEELEAILDTATDGVVVIDGRGRIGSMNLAAQALFGVEGSQYTGRYFTDLLADESQKAALDYLDGLAANGVASVLNDGREVIGRVPQGGLIPLFMTMGRIGTSDKFCAVLRDITHWKNVEAELISARRAAETANAQKSDFLAKISHEIRTPLNAIIGFSEVMMSARFGPIGNERYRDYLHDIHVSGAHLLSLINDLLDLSKIEAGKLELAFESVPVNAAIQECVALMQPQANRERIIIRTSLSADVPNVVADQRSFRQILLNIMSNAVKFTRAGGQVIVSTSLEDSGEVVVRIRDTGIGMSEKDIETALKPFRQVALAKDDRDHGTGLGLPLTKALVEANRATFAIDSAVNQGTLVKITFPTTRVLAG